MKADPIAFKRATTVSLLGLTIQIVLALTLLLYGVFGQDRTAITGFYYTLLGIPVWLGLALVFHQHRLERQELAEAELLSTSSAAQASVFAEIDDELRVAGKRLAWMHKVLLPVMSLLTAGGLIGVGLWQFGLGRAMLEPGAFDFVRTDRTGWAVALGISIGVVGFIFARFVAGMAKQTIWANLRAGASCLVGVALVGLAIGVAHGAAFAGANIILRYLHVALPVFMMLIGVEIVLNLVLNAYRPRRPGEIPRPAFDSRILGFVAAHIADLRRQGVGNAAVVIIENESREVRAMVGSAGFTEAGFQGQVNGALARRSPGSALKPFLYALSFDTGRVVPDSYLLDVPTDYSGYVAENYDGRYRGRVTAREALVQSLNAPAVRLLSETGVEPLLQVLRRGGLSTLDRPSREYGLPLILGSGEVRLLDLTNLYATLAESGRHKPWRLTPGAPAVSNPLISTEAAQLVTEILSELNRPDMPAAWDLTRDIPAVAWKTGTSYGHRDAWAVGFSARMTVGVWVGNPDGRAQKGISGAEHAAPLLFDLFRAVEGGATRLPERHALGIEMTPVCAASHDLPGPFCPHRKLIRYLPSRTRLRRCEVHRRVFVDGDTGLLLAGDCLATRPHRTQVLEIQPPELVAWWRTQGLQVPSLPGPEPGLRRHPRGGGTAHHISLGFDALPAARRCSRTVSADPAHRTDRRRRRAALLVSGRGARCRAAPGATLFLPPGRGAHRLVLVDSAGRSDSITYTIE